MSDLIFVLVTDVLLISNNKSIDFINIVNDQWRLFATYVPI